MAGYTSGVWLPILHDFIHVGEQLEQLGFTYFKGKVVIVEPIEERTYA
jgi:hypothetical protein